MLTPAPFAPRFEILAWVPQYGSRDEITGRRAVVEAVAFTRGWAEVLANRAAVAHGVDDGNTELAIEIHDLRPDLACSERAAELRAQGYNAHATTTSYGAPTIVIEYDDDLPF